MAKPRIFVSSTYYDLKHIRASLDLFIDQLGYESVLSEKGSIAYAHDQPLDESCYREAKNSDIFVLIVGGRYGSEISGSSDKQPSDFFARYESITKKEYETASQKEIPIYILIEKGVYGEYQTFTRNKGNNSINYAYVENINVFLFIENILSKQKNNPVQTFEKFDDIKGWLREQWAGVFKELLAGKADRQQLSDLSSQVSALKDVSGTLKLYIEAMMKGAGDEEKTRLIESEEVRLETMEKLRANAFARYLGRNFSIPIEDVLDVLVRSSDVEDMGRRVQELSTREDVADTLSSLLDRVAGARIDLNDAREIVGRAGFFEITDEDRSKRAAMLARRKEMDTETAAKDKQVSASPKGLRRASAPIKKKKDNKKK